MPAVITAGGRISGPFAEASGTSIKALAPIGDRCVLDLVIAALRESGRAGTVVVVGPKRELETAGVSADVILEEGATGPENMLRGLRHVRAEADATGDGRALLCATDLPFLTGAAVRWFVDTNRASDADIVFPVVTRQSYEAALPGSPNTYAPVAGGWYTGGSVQIVRPGAIEANLMLIEKAFAARKSLFQMAALLGLPFLLRFLTRTLSIAQAEAQASRMTGCRCRAFTASNAPHGADALLCADIDNITDYLRAVIILSEEGGTAATPPANLISEVAR